MDQKWIHVLVILVFHHKMTSAETNIRDIREGQKVDIKCAPKLPSGILIIWWRVLDTSDMEFIGSFSTSSGMPKTVISKDFSHTKIAQSILTLKSFRKSHDSGVYFCATLKTNTLHFGNVTRLSGAAPVEKAKTTVSSEGTRPPTPAACVCDDRKKKGFAGEASVSTTLCAPIILGPLAGSCGLLLLLLIIISVHCNKIRTRRCPHHHKKKPRAVPPGKQVMANRLV